MAVMVAARISLTGSARKTPRHLSTVKQGRIKISGISRMIFRRQASRRPTFGHGPSAIKRALAGDLATPMARMPAM